jgi:RNA polymerase sigma-70 factor (ECF subfamily)
MQRRSPVSERSVPVKQAMLKLIPNLRAFAVSLCGDIERADDLVQETLLKAWDHIESFQEGTNLRAWMFTILRNTYFSECRRRRREVEDDGSKAAELAVHPGQDGYVDMQDFRRALNVLPPDQREALILVGAAGFSYEEAAKISNCAVGTIKSRVNRARAKLTEMLGVAASTDFGPDSATESVVARAGIGGFRSS